MPGAGCCPPAGIGSFHGRHMWHKLLPSLLLPELLHRAANARACVREGQCGRRQAATSQSQCCHCTCCSPKSTALPSATPQQQRDRLARRTAASTAANTQQYAPDRASLVRPIAVRALSASTPPRTGTCGQQQREGGSGHVEEATLLLSQPPATSCLNCTSRATKHSAVQPLAATCNQAIDNAATAPGWRAGRSRK